ncbi:MAG: division/cell wall cluster transcriptional repressor MraZ [Candidatus Marinimicrobia bacterium]|nr:division/cell wall cluster transcriptional repressor MraZ [Candidatus Neomarinimicrobiota bacterium]
MNNNFSDNFLHKLDTKNRVSIPAAYRQWTDEEQVEFVMSKGPDTCIVVYPAPEWDEFIGNLTAKLRKTNRNQRAYLRKYTHDASRVKCDKQGRMLVPQKLLDFAQIKDNVKIVGMGDTFELWSEEIFNQDELNHIPIDDDFFAEIEANL